MESKILLVSHVYFTDSGPVYGPVDVIKGYLETKKRKFLLIKYRLNSRLPLIIKSVFEMFNTVFRCILYKPDTFLGIDPLNAFSGVVLKKLGLAKRTIFYCVDYTPTRFKNRLLNTIYLKIDTFCSRNSDEVWNVSTRIVNIRKKQGVKDERIKFVPNSPSFTKCLRLPAEKVDRKKIVMVTGLTHSPVFNLVLKSFKISLKRFTDLKLSIIGTGDYQNKLIEKVKKMKLSKNVNFLGQLNNKDLLDEVSKSGIALAIYTFSKNYSWVYYGDSKKAREYLACGVPVIMTNLVGTSEDIARYGAGFVIKPNVKELTEAMEKLASDKNIWLKTRKNAIKLGQDFDINKVLDGVFS